MEAPSEDFAVVPDNGAQQHPGSTSGFPPLRDQQFTPKMFAYDGQAAQQYLAGLGNGALPTSVVPVLNQRQQPAGSAAQQQQQRLSASQQSELEMARRRAEKAAEGKRANATAARRAKRRASRKEPIEQDGAESSEDLPLSNSKDDIEARLATVEDEKEAKRLKRLLRNRVSAQQARERKKSYVSTLESKSAGQDDKIAQLGQRVKTLERENVMLRQIIRNMQQSSEQYDPPVEA